MLQPMSPTPAELTLRCPYCSAYPAVFILQGSQLQTVDRVGKQVQWNAASCPGCGGIVVLRLTGSGTVADVQPRTVGEWEVAHLDPTVEPMWAEASGVFAGGYYRSAVVQCGAALEAAFDARGIGDAKTSLVQRVHEAREKGLLTDDLEQAVQYARLIRNAGAHGGRAVKDVSQESARGAMRFTQQTLRLLFEVPGELALLTGQPPELEGTAEADEEVD